MFFLIFGLVRLMWATVKLMAWLVWAVIAVTVILIASATGNERTARQWSRTLRGWDII